MDRRQFDPTPFNFGDLALGVTSSSLIASIFTSYGQAPQFSRSITGPDASDFAVSFFGSGYMNRAGVTFTPHGLVRVLPHSLLTSEISH